MKGTKRPASGRGGVRSGAGNKKGSIRGPYNKKKSRMICTGYNSELKTNWLLTGRTKFLGIGGIYDRLRVETLKTLRNEVGKF